MDMFDKGSAMRRDPSSWFKPRHRVVSLSFSAHMEKRNLKKQKKNIQYTYEITLRWIKCQGVDKVEIVAELQDS